MREATLYPLLSTHQERGREKDTTVCGGRDRERHIYTSDSNSVHVEVAGGRRGGNFGYFLLQYEGEYFSPAVVPPNILSGPALQCHCRQMTFVLCCFGKILHGPQMRVTLTPMSRRAHKLITLCSFHGAGQFPNTKRRWCWRDIQ